MSKKKAASCLLLLLALCVCPSFGQAWLTRMYTELDGLPSSNVYDIAQDQLGRVWLATRAGIAVHDGISWKSFDESNGLAYTAFAKIAVDRQGHIWAVTDPRQLAVISIVSFDGSRWQRISELKVGVSERGEITSFRILERAGHQEVLVAVATRGLLRWAHGKWQRLTTDNGLLSSRINSILPMKGKCYLATDQGISVLTGDGSIDNKLNQSLNFPSKEIKGVCREGDKRVWLFGSGWLGYFDEDKPHTAQTVCFRTGIAFSKGKQPVRLLPDRFSGLYIGNLYELFYFNYKTQKSRRLTMANGFVGLGVNAMMCDFEKNIWIACDRGITRISSRRFDSFDMRHGLSEDEVTAVLEYEPGKFALGHNNSLTLYDGSRFVKVPLIRDDKPQPLLCRVLDLAVDSRRNIWVAASFMGLARIDKQGKIGWYGKEHGLPDKITSLCIDQEDTLWLGTEDGVFAMNRYGLVRCADSSVPTISIRKIYGDRRGPLYLAGHDSGIYVRETTGWQHYRKEGNDKINAVYAMKEDSKGRLLVGTTAGLFILEERTLKKFREKDFEINQPVYFIVEDTNHRLWLGTNNGVVCWDGNRKISYSVPQGLLGQETNRAAGIVDSQGRVWIGTNRGLSIYQQGFDNTNSDSPPPKVRLLHLETDDNTIPFDRPVELSHKNHNLRVHFRGISFLDETAIRFKHKLEGFDKDWSQEHYPFDQAIVYAGLPSGSYRFHLKARNSLGIWSDAVVSPEIIVKKPYYRQWWFYLVGLAVVGLVFTIVFNFILTRRSAVKLERLVKERTSQLQASERRYRTLFEDSRDTILITKGSRIVDINPAGVALLGYGSKEEVLNLDIETDLYYDPNKRKTFKREIAGKGYVKDYEQEWKRKDGEKVTVQVTATRVTDDRDDNGIIHGIIRDITEKKRSQEKLEQTQRLESLGTMAGGIAHDFNNILAMIIGYLELSLDDLGQSSQVQENIEQAYNAATRAKELIRQILTFSRRDPQAKKPLDLGLLVKEVLKLLRSSLPTTIEIRQDIAESAIVMANPSQVQQVLMNLCTNAAHAMRANGGVLEVKLRKVDLDEASAAAYDNISAGPYLRLTVSDTGHGISPRIIKRIFEPYFTTKRKGEGTGLGLSVIHGIIKGHGGEVTVYSEPGKGTTFNVLLPLAEPGEQTVRLRKEETPPGGNSEHILFVDDEPSLVDVGKRLLLKLGYRVTSKNSSSDALAAFQTAPDSFDLVITDQTMPHMTGIQLTEKIRALRPHIPIILCTGFSETLTPQITGQLDIEDVLMKPISKNKLADAIRKALKKKKR